MWTWIAGTSNVDQANYFTSKGVASTAFSPGTREGALAWFDAVNRDLWLFGGLVYYTGSNCTNCLQTLIVNTF